MHQFPPGFNKRIAIGGAIAAVVMVLLGVTFFGGRPTIYEERQRSLDSLDVDSHIRGQTKRSLQGFK